MDEVHKELARKCRDENKDHADMVRSLEEERSAAVDRARTMLDALRPLVGNFHNIQLHFCVFNALARRAAVAAAARDGRDATQRRQLPELRLHQLTMRLDKVPSLKRRAILGMTKF